MGLFRIEQIGGRWKIFLSNAASILLCSVEPDVEKFCRAQLSLFQYPNGAGLVPYSGRVQDNALDSTVQIIANNIRINPLRLICKYFVALHELDNRELVSIFLPYQTLFMLMNDARVNTSFSPDETTILDALHEYGNNQPPSWANTGNNLINFKRNFHILEWTGLFTQERMGRSTRGLKIAINELEDNYSMIRKISRMTHNFLEFENCYGNTDARVAARSVILNHKWGTYYDSMTTHSAPSEITEVFGTPTALALNTVPSHERSFPDMRELQLNQIRTFVHSGQAIDPLETLVLREKANRQHLRLLKLLVTRLNYHNFHVSENVFIDLFVNAEQRSFIFEIKSNNPNNTLSQIRKAVAQLYEYRYRSNQLASNLCIVLQQKPLQEWIINYLLNDRLIMLCWLVDETRLECPNECRSELSGLGILE